MKDEALIRIGLFAGIFFILVIFELLAPRRQLHTKKSIRWISNLGITFLSTALLRVLFPVLTIEMALLAQQRSWGIFNVVAVPDLIAIIAGVVVFDLAFYLQHVIFHSIPMLWRLHMVHHTDIDVTSGFAFILWKFLSPHVQKWVRYT